MRGQSCAALMRVYTNVILSLHSCPFDLPSQTCFLNNENDTYTDATGVITSLNYPSNYSNSLNERFLILGSDPQNRISLTFNDFDVESSPDCANDFLQISDLTGRIPPTKYCGSDAIPPLTYETNHLLLEFQTDSSTTQTGFNFTYEIFTEQNDTYTDATGVITSLNYPSNYSNSLNERFLILGSDPQNRIYLTFNDFDVESSPDCANDFLQISDLTGRIPPTKYCGSDALLPLTFETNHLLLEFQTDSSTTQTGFNLTYEIFTEQEYEIYTDVIGVITSPNYPSNSVNSFFKRYLILGDHSQNYTSLAFNDFDLESSTDCVNEVLQIRALTEQIPPIRLCGNNRIPTLIFETKYLLLEFQADFNMTKSGFNLTYNIFSFNEISNSEYPNLYRNNVLEKWNIYAARKTDRIRLEFQHLDIEDLGSCFYDRLSLSCDETFPVGNTTVLCGYNIPQAFMSNCHILYIRFETDDSITYTGFKFTYEIISD